MDNASSHISIITLKLLEEQNISFIQIPSEMTLECQPLNISVNKNSKIK